jgi:hypothetical protein
MKPAYCTTAPIMTPPNQRLSLMSSHISLTTVQNRTDLIFTLFALDSRSADDQFRHRMIVCIRYPYT